MQQLNISFFCFIVNNFVGDILHFFFHCFICMLFIYVFQYIQ